MAIITKWQVSHPVIVLHTYGYYFYHIYCIDNLSMNYMYRWNIRMMWFPKYWRIVVIKWILPFSFVNNIFKCIYLEEKSMLLKMSWNFIPKDLGDAAIILKAYFSKSVYREVAWTLTVRLYRVVAWALAVKLLWSECNRTSLLESQHWFRWWLVAIRQQAISWASIHLNLCRHMESQVHNVLK